MARLEGQREGRGCRRGTATRSTSHGKGSKKVSKCGCLPKRRELLKFLSRASLDYNFLGASLTFGEP